MEEQDNPTMREILLDAAELPPEKRNAFLEIACGGNTELRAEVAALLESLERAEGVVRDATVEPNELRSASIEGSSRSVNGEGAGTRIGRYRLLQLIGEGGFGSVFMAEQETPVVRKVALKIIKLGMDTRRVIARFEAERQALAMMDHPNIAHVHDAGATESGRPYFVMELVRGVPITTFCDANQLTTRQRLELFVPVCSALQHAHQKGIIHRDLKPGNVLVTMHDDKPVPKIIDFGVAKAINQRLTEHTLFTEFHQLIGTPAYMSPEQAQLSGLDVDTRSDIYSLGVLLYELLTGSTPFDATELRSAAYEEMQRIIREVEPPKASTRLSTLPADTRSAVADQRRCDPATLRRTLEGDLDWIMMKCLEKDRSRRYETANGLARDLERYLHDEPVEASPPSTADKFRRFARKHRMGLGVTAGFALVLLIATAVSSWQAVRATRAEKKTAASLAQVAAERDAKEVARKDAEAISNFLSDVFQSPDPTRDGRTIKVVELLDKAAEKLDSDLTSQPDHRAKLQATLGQTYNALGLFGQAIPLREKVRDYYLATLGAEHPDTLRAMSNLAGSYADAGRKDEAFKMQEEVLTLRRKVNGPEHSDTLRAMAFLARLFDGGRKDEALRLREDVLTLRRKVNGPEHRLTIAAMHELAISYADAGRKDEALKMREEVLTLSRKVDGPEDRNTLTAMHNLAVSYDDAGRRDQAIKMQEEVLKLRRKVNGPKHPDTLMAMNNLVRYYDDAGRKDEALKMQEELLTLSGKVRAPEDPETLRAIGNLANSYAQTGRKGDALRLREEMLTLSRKVLGPKDPDTLRWMYSLANSYYDAGRKEEALKMWEEVLTLRRQVLGPEDRETVEAMNGLAASYAGAGRKDEALKMREEVLTLSRKVLGPKDPDTLAAMHNLANSYYDAGRKEEALKMREEVLTLSRKVDGREGRHTLMAMQSLAFSYADSGRKEDAMKLFQEFMPYEVKAKTAEVEAQPSNPNLWADRGKLYARMGRFREAADDYAKAIEISPDNHRYWHDGLMPLLLQIGDIDGFRQHVSDELKQFGATKDGASAHRVAKDALAIPLEGEDLKLALELTERAKSAPHNWYYQNERMAAYRSGNYSAAIGLIQQTRDLDPEPSRQIATDLFLAMSYQRLGDHAKAGEILDRTVQRMVKELPKPGVDDFSDFPDVILCLALRREAEGLINGTGPTTKAVASTQHVATN